jgi:two-component system LytT family response regulator
MKALKIVIIDDEADAVNLLKLQLDRHCNLNNVTTYTNALLALEELKKSPPDLLFLDIEMPLLNGFELLQRLMPVNFAVIFITAYNQYAIKAFKFDATDYLVKPIDADDLIAAVLRTQTQKALTDKELNVIQKRIKGSLIDKMAISTHEGVSFIDLNEIIYAEADSNYTTLILINERRFVISKTLKDLQELLEESHFLRIHRQYIINLNHLKHLDRSKSLLTMVNKHELSIAREQKDKLMEMYKWL